MWNRVLVTWGLDFLFPKVKTVDICAKQPRSPALFVVLSTFKILEEFLFPLFTSDSSVHVPVDFLQQWVQSRVRLCLFDDLH